MSRTNLDSILHLASGLLIWLYLAPLQAQTGSSCSSLLRGIEVSGAEVTKSQNLIKWSGLSIGQQLTAQDLDQARQQLFDTSLFKNVRIEHGDLCAESVTLKIHVKEKIYHLVYPRLDRNADGDISTGIRYRGSNLFGADQSLSIRYTQKDKDSGEQTEEVDLSYEMPMITSPYILRWTAETADTLLDDSSNEIHRLRDEFKIEIGRDWLSGLFQRPIAILAELRFKSIDLEGDASSLETEPGSYNSLGISLEYDDIHEEKYRRFGKFYRIEIARGSSLLASDFKATLFKAEGLWFKPLNETDNLNARLVLELASARVFNEYNYSIGGSNTIRGIRENSQQGNALWLANIEYVIGSQRWPSYRTALFCDISNVFEDATTLNSDDWNATLGIGLRWKLTSFVKTDLVIDYGYDPQTDYSKIYASTSLLF